MLVFVKILEEQPLKMRKKKCKFVFKNFLVLFNENFCIFNKNKREMKLKNSLYEHMKTNKTNEKK